MQLTPKEEKIARLALDKGAKDGERQAAAAKLIESLYARGVTVEDIEKVNVIEKVVVKTAYRTRPTVEPVAPKYTSPVWHPPEEPSSQWHTWGETFDILRRTVIGIAIVFAILGAFAGIGQAFKPKPEPAVTSTRVSAPISATGYKVYRMSDIALDSATPAPIATPAPTVKVGARHHNHK
jgi:hypothetical protein